VHRDGESARERHRQQQRADHRPPRRSRGRVPCRATGLNPVAADVGPGAQLPARPDLGVQGRLGLEDPGQPNISSPQSLRLLADTTICPERRVLASSTLSAPVRRAETSSTRALSFATPRPVESDPAQADHTRGPAQRQCLHDQVSERRQVLLAEIGDRSIARGRAGGRHRKAASSTHLRSIIRDEHTPVV